MKRLFFFVCLLLCTVVSYARETGMPSYYTAVQYFFKHYDISEPSYFSFARKPAGWYVRELDLSQLTDADSIPEYTSEYLLWEKSSGEYMSINALPKGTSDATAINTFWESKSYDWYDMNRDLYYGYNGWEIDVIQKLRNKTPLNDTLRESLARAYSIYADRYLWYQAGGKPIGNDPLQPQRKCLEPVPAAAADSAAHYIRLATEQYKLIAAHNPAYATKVGNASLKIFNEQMNGWSVLNFAGYPEKAADFLKSITLDSCEISEAKYLLDACPPNSILFTYGDNDTYQPWYVQSVLGYRKDIAVVNTSLLGMPQYIDWLKHSRAADFRLKEAVYGKADNYYTRIEPAASKSHEEEREGTVQEVTLDDHSGMLQAPDTSHTDFTSPKTAGSSVQKYHVTVYDNLELQVQSIAVFIDSLNIQSAVRSFKQEGYHIDSLFIPVSKTAGVWKSQPYKFLNRIYPVMKNVYTIDELMIMDIAAANINQRPLCFTDDIRLFPQYDFPAGMVHRLIPADTGAAMNKTATNNTLKQLLVADMHWFRQLKGAGQSSQDKVLFGYIVRNILYLVGYYDETKQYTLLKELLHTAAKFLDEQQGLAYWENYGIGIELVKHDVDKPIGVALLERFMEQKKAEYAMHDNALVQPAETKPSYYDQVIQELLSK